MEISLWRYILTHLSKFSLKYIKRTGFLIVFFIVFFFSFNVLASNKCSRFFSIPKIGATLNYGEVVYKSVPKSELLQLDKLNNPEKTLGVTVADLLINYSFEFSEHPLSEGVCIDLSKIDFFVGYKNLSVLIDDKYAQNSCEYKAIKEHEQKHIQVYQQELKYYGGLLIDELRNISQTMQPMYFAKLLNHKAFAMNIEEHISTNETIIILREKLENSLVKLNQAIDTEQEYLRVKSLCDEW